MEPICHKMIELFGGTGVYVVVRSGRVARSIWSRVVRSGRESSSME
jgi:hypothetical protein